MRRVLCIWFPSLASDRTLRLRPHDGPFALEARSGASAHLHCVNAAARAARLGPGMTLADARALCPTLVTRPADPPAEATFLEALRRWAERFSPRVARDGAEGLAADATGVAHLFGGEAALCGEIVARLARGGVAASVGLADTRGAAWALSRHGGGIAPEGKSRAALAALPLSALRLDHDSVEGLRRLGLRDIAALEAAPRAPLSRRFGPSVLLRLDQALGRAAEAVSPEPPAPRFAVRLSLPEPIGLKADVAAGLERLLARLCARLEAAGMGARRLVLALGRVDGETARVSVGLARPLREAERIAALFDRGLDEVDSGFGIESLRLEAVQVERLVPRQQTTARETGEDRLADLLSRMGNRIGFEHIRRMLPAESHIPERSFIAAAAFAPPARRWPAGPPRPVVMFAPEIVHPEDTRRPPARFRWRRMRFSTARAIGPERIAPEWWLDDPQWRSGLRDYWRVETREGRRLWLYHTPQAPCWRAQGEFA